jgi:hypothetical protein
MPGLGRSAFKQPRGRTEPAAISGKVVACAGIWLASIIHTSQRLLPVVCTNRRRNAVDGCCPLIGVKGAFDMVNRVRRRSMFFGFVLCAVASCGKPGVIEVQPVPSTGSAAGSPATGSAAGSPATGSMNGGAPSSETAGPCPSGYNCMNLSALGGGMDGAGAPVNASCSMGGIVPCDDADPTASCSGLTNPVCVHLNVGGMALVSCGQRCNP